MGRSAKTELALLPPERQAKWLSAQPPWVLNEISRGEWWFTGRPEQQEPPGNWFIWLLLSGRGFGKTRTAAEWLADRVLRFPADTSGFRTEWLIIAETLTDGLRLCVTGPAGIGRVLQRRLGDERRSATDGTGRWKLYRGNKPFIQLWDAQGAESSIIYIEGADNEDVGRGYNAAGAWLDEFCIAAGQTVETSGGPVAIENVVPGDQVRTRQGWRPVAHAGLTRRSAPTLVIRAGGRSVTCTANHRVWTERGWVRADEVRPNDIMALWANLSPARPHGLNGPVSAGTATARTATTESATAPSSTSPCGDAWKDGKCPTGITSTTETTIAPTTPATTSSSWMKRSTAGITRTLARMRRGWTSRSPRPSAPASLPTGSAASPARSSATSVGAPSTAQGCAPSAAPTTVAGSTAGSWQRATVESVTTGPRADVYDLTVEGVPEFTVDGLLVHNCKWPKPDGSWIEGIAPSLRAELPGGEFPRVIVATTPKLVVQLVEWKKRTDGTVYLTTGSTYDNASNLAAPTLAEMHRRYAGTRIGRQELLGELIEEIEGAMWKLDWMERFRVHPGNLPNLNLRVVGMDPAGTGERDETGLVCAARGTDGVDYILGDWSKQTAGAAAARRAWEMLLAYSADFVAIEKQSAKLWVRDVMTSEYKAMQREGLFPPGGVAPLKEVPAKVGKKLRAAPVAARYEQQFNTGVPKVRHVLGQNLQDMETQMVSWVPEETPDSPDRVDALVYAELELFSRERFEVQAVSAVDHYLPNMSTMGPLS